MKKNEGITLIALIITIIILIILTAVTINNVIGTDLIGFATKAVENYTDAARDEADKVDKLVDTFDNKRQEKTNPPELSDGMIPIKYDDGNKRWVICTKDDPEWYSYTEEDRKWANVMLSDGTYKGETAVVGKEVAEEDLGSMFVWIPRYAYRITSGYHTGDSKTSGTIEIKFLKGTENKDASGSSINIVENLTADQIQKTGDSGPSIVDDEYVVHPAFKWGSSEQAIRGIWVAKFEASKVDAPEITKETEIVTDGTDKSKLKVVPNVTSWRNITIDESFTKCESYNPNLKSHLMKNSEWAAVVYLAHSKYGRNGKETGINQCSDYITGAGPGITAEVKDYKYTDVQSEFETRYSYLGTQGKKASTTENETGVYDISGGSWEYVAAYMNNEHENLTTYGQSVVNAEYYKKEVYEKSSISDTSKNNYNANTSRYGDAVYETSSVSSLMNSWFGDFSDFPYVSGPFFIRGGGSTDGDNSGSFAFGVYTGIGAEHIGFRPVLVTI